MFLHAFSCLVVLAAAPADPGRLETFRRLRERVDRQVLEWRPTIEERAFDRIGWSTSLVEAEKLARQAQRPIFLFTHDGRMNVGRC
jgi:hypothetical protein